MIAATTVVLHLALAFAAQEQETETRGLAVLDAEPQEGVNGYADRHALLIGIDDYEDDGFPDLGCAVADAKGVRSSLVERFGFPEDNVRLLRNEEATGEAIAVALDEWLCDADRVGENDLIVVFFAGHGVTRDLGGTDRKRGYLVPVDGIKGKTDPRWTTLYSMQYLEEASEAIPAKHVLFILDCCFGGIAADRAGLIPTAGLQSRARQIMTAGSENQTVEDDSGGGHSVFTAELLAALDGAADKDANQVLDFGEIYQYVGGRVELQTDGRQTPEQDVFRNHDGGMVSLFAPGVRPPPATVAERLAALQQTAEELAEEVIGYSDARLVDELLREAKEDLWPRRERTVQAYEDWLVRAGEVLTRRENHRTALDRVRERAYLELFQAGRLEVDPDGEPVWEEVDSGLAWRFDTLRALVDDLDHLEEFVSEIRDRLSFAQTIRARTVDAYQEEWDEALNEIALGEVYERYELEEIAGLVPIGTDPESGLWEFWHVESGARPQRDPETERLIPTEESGIVLVLIPVPGGTTTIGSQNGDPDAPYFDPIHEVDEVLREVALEPFLLSKYEMTQGQWRRLTRSNPSYHHLGYGGPVTVSLLHPVEAVSWAMCQEVLARFDLGLPAEVKWEHAARAGTTTPWWTGQGAELLDGAAHLVHRSREAFFAGEQRYRAWYGDGREIHAVVGSKRANAFGLHDVHGNVGEWCQDAYGEGRSPATGDRLRVHRGGSFRYPAIHARSALRLPGAPNHRSDDLGVRPAGIIPVRGPASADDLRRGR